MSKYCFLIGHHSNLDLFLLNDTSKSISSAFIALTTDVWRLSPKFFMANILFGIYLRFICVRPEIPFCFVKKTPTKYSKPWTRDSQCQDGYSSLAENAPTFFGPICLLKPKSLGFSKKSSVWVSVCGSLQRKKLKVDPAHQRSLKRKYYVAHHLQP